MQDAAVQLREEHGESLSGARPGALAHPRTISSDSCERLQGESRFAPSASAPVPTRRLADERRARWPEAREAATARPTPVGVAVQWGARCP
jgi:hypothetical protein